MAECRTTIPDTATDRPLDVVDRQFAATQANQLWVADLTYVATWAGFVQRCWSLRTYSSHSSRKEHE